MPLRFPRCGFWFFPLCEFWNNQEQPSEERQPFRNRGRFRERVPTRQRRSDSLVVIPFPLRVPEAARQRATIKGKGVAAMGATTITVSHKAKALRFPRCDSVPSESSRSGKAKGNHQGQGRSGNGSDNHHSKPQGKAVPIPSLWIPFPLLRLLARSLLSDQKAPRQRATIRGTQGIKARTFASMEATTIKATATPFGIRGRFRQ